MNKIILIMITAIVSLNAVYAQDISEVQFNSCEDSIKQVFELIAVSKDDSFKVEQNRIILSRFDKILQSEEAFDYPFDSLRYLGKIRSDDDKVKILTWNLAFNNGTYKYFGYILYKHKGEVKVFKLNDNKEEIKNPQKDVLSDKMWLGALYFDIIRVKDKKRHYYTLLGWDGNDMFTNKKIIEILYFTKSGQPRFGAPLIKVKNKTYRRAIFEYANRASMMLRYFEKDKKIIFDHLSPSESRFEGQKQYYGPDFSYDALEFRKGKWHYLSTITFKSKDDPNIKKPRKGL